MALVRVLANGGSPLARALVKYAPQEKTDPADKELLFAEKPEVSYFLPAENRTKSFEKHYAERVPLVKMAGLIVCLLYTSYMRELLAGGIMRISSGELAERMHVTASQIRQDLNCFGGFGQQGYGYNVKYLYGEISKILGVDRGFTAIIVGVGNLGRALINTPMFEKRGVTVKGLFDVSRCV